MLRATHRQLSGAQKL